MTSSDNSLVYSLHVRPYKWTSRRRGESTQNAIVLQTYSGTLGQGFRSVSGAILPMGVGVATLCTHVCSDYQRFANTLTPVALRELPPRPPSSFAVAESRIRVSSRSGTSITNVLVSRI